LFPLFSLFNSTIFYILCIASLSIPAFKGKLSSSTGNAWEEDGASDSLAGILSPHMTPKHDSEGPKEKDRKSRRYSDGPVDTREVVAAGGAKSEADVTYSLEVEELEKELKLLEEGNEEEDVEELRDIDEQVRELDQEMQQLEEELSHFESADSSLSDDLTVDEEDGSASEILRKSTGQVKAHHHQRLTPGKNTPSASSSDDDLARPPAALYPAANGSPQLPPAGSASYPTTSYNTQLILYYLPRWRPHITSPTCRRRKITSSA